MRMIRNREREEPLVAQSEDGIKTVRLVQEQAQVIEEILTFLDDMNDGAPDSMASEKEAGRLASRLRASMRKVTT